MLYVNVKTVTHVTVTSSHNIEKNIEDSRTMIS